MPKYLHQIIQNGQVIEASVEIDGEVTIIDLEANNIVSQDDLLTYFQTTYPMNADEIKENALTKIAIYREGLQSFCRNFIDTMMDENIYMGIGSEDITLVTQVMAITEPTIKAVESGALKVAIALIKEIPEEQLDGKYLTSTRLTEKRNLIHSFLRIPPITNYKD